MHHSLFYFTSGAAFLFCSPPQLLSRPWLASKQTGHTRLVLLSKVFEHFAQMACRRTPLEKHKVWESKLDFPPLPTLSMFIYPQQWPNGSICTYRSAGFAVMLALGEIEALIAASARLFLFLLFLGALLKIMVIKKQWGRCKGVATSKVEGMSDSLLCLFSFSYFC